MQEISIKEIEMENELFARGESGKVYMAKWRKKNVVVKVIRATSGEEEAVKSKDNVILRLSHRNVIQQFGVTWIASKEFGIVMEKAEHGSLDMWIGKIDHEKLTKIALGIVDGLDCVHSQNVVHGNIKPKNIFMFGPSDDMTPKIANFGASKVFQPVIKTCCHVGDGQELHMACDGRSNLQHRFVADIFGLAMTLFEMFNNQLTTDVSDDVKRFMLGLQGGRISKIPESSKVPAHLHDVIQRGWSDNPHERPTLDQYRSTLRGK